MLVIMPGNKRGDARGWIKVHNEDIYHFLLFYKYFRAKKLK
jgi:hypothetical protein